MLIPSPPVCFWANAGWAIVGRQRTEWLLAGNGEDGRRSRDDAVGQATVDAEVAIATRVAPTETGTAAEMH
ncbi:MAG TPA: hypothetical protein PKX14_06650, partial [Thauera aminoaromatica]|nr:hypothetical protein [Thauera aminoaromatica]HNC66615.1 hypothetical protein [Thauera aminoaromatica]HNF76454.1 hypothetical protein [Thauera aminoaromatica]